MEIPCSVCDMIFNSEAQASQHFRGVKHAKRLKMAEDFKAPSKSNSDGMLQFSFALYLAHLYNENTSTIGLGDGKQ